MGQLGRVANRGHPVCAEVCSMWLETGRVQASIGKLWPAKDPDRGVIGHEVAMWKGCQREQHVVCHWGG